MFENPRRGREARNFTTNVPKMVDRKSSSEQIFSENYRWVPLLQALSTNYSRCNIQLSPKVADLKKKAFDEFRLNMLIVFS